MRPALALLALWAAACLFAAWRTPGDDLSSLYFAARFVGTGRADVVYAHDPASFAEVSDPTWRREAAATGFTGYLHPYVQPPIWAVLVSPVALGMPFTAFNSLALILNVAALAGSVLLAARLWNRDFLRPRYLLPFLVLFTVAVPLRYALALNQTQCLVLFLTLLALDRVDRVPALAGIALAGATMIKLTPAVVAVYWLLTGRWRSLAWLSVMLSLVGLASVLAVDPRLNATCLARMREISSSLVMGYNNQSLAVALEAARRPVPLDWHLAPAPEASSIVMNGAMLMLLCAAGWRLRDADGQERDRIGVPLLLTATMVGAPIAWTHYYLVVLLATMSLPSLYTGRLAAVGWALAGTVWLLNSPLLSPHRTTLWRTLPALTWVHLYSAVLLIAALLVAAGSPARRAASP